MIRAPVSGAVLQALAELRRATPQDIVERLDWRFTLYQVQRALSKARINKLVCNNGLVRQKGVHGAVMSTYWLPGDDPPQVEEREADDLWKPNRVHPKRPQYASVWDYAGRIGAQASRAEIPKL